MSNIGTFDNAASDAESRNRHSGDKAAGSRVTATKETRMRLE
jgi:hypothetical protein